MTDEELLDPDRIARAKARAAGPEGEQMAKFPLRFAQAALFGPRKGSPKVNNGVISQIDLGHRRFGITCWHVLEGFRQLRENEPDSVFRIGNVEIDPLARLVDESRHLDLAVLDLDGIRLADPGEEIGASCFEPVHWPPGDVNVGDYVAFGGFPGVWRWTDTGHREIVFEGLSTGGMGVTAVAHDRIICQFDRAYWVNSYSYQKRNATDLYEWGGMSGGPVFIFRHLFAEFVGVIFEYAEGLDLLYIRPASLIGSDGRIQAAW